MKAILAFFILISVVGAQAKSHVVLFRQSEIAVAGMAHGQFQQMLQASNEKNIGQLKDWMGGRALKSTVGNLWLVRGAVVDLDAAAVKKLEREPWVHGVLEDKERRLIAPPLNVREGQRLQDLGEEPHNLWGLARIGLPKIRAEFPTIDGTGVRVGIIDTGIQSRHPELGDKQVQFKDFVNGILSPYDDHGHGTHVAGTISGVEVGIAPKVSILFAKAFSAVGSASDSQLLAAMQWMFDPDEDPATNDFPQVVSNSWGGDLSAATVQSIAEFLPYQLAIQTWIHGGIVPVFAAGNSGSSPNGFPGGLPEPLAVGAIASDDKIAAFSSRGPNIWKIGETVLSLLKPDISAPGVAITSAIPGNKYATWDGTSMATPHVTGAIALALQANPKLKYTDVKSLLLASSEPKANTSFGYGILDAYKLVKLAQTR